MNYYRLSFNKVTVPDPAKPFHRKWQWYSLVCEAQNRGEAKDHGRHVASMEGVSFVDAIRLPKVVGAVLIAKPEGFHEI